MLPQYALLSLLQCPVASLQGCAQCLDPALLVSLLLCSVMSLQPSAGCLWTGLLVSLLLQQPVKGLQIPAQPQSHDLLVHLVLLLCPAEAWQPPARRQSPDLPVILILQCSCMHQCGGCRIGCQLRLLQMPAAAALGMTAPVHQLGSVLGLPAHMPRFLLHPVPASELIHHGLCLQRPWACSSLPKKACSADLQAHALQKARVSLPQRLGAPCRRFSCVCLLHIPTLPRPLMDADQCWSQSYAPEMRPPGRHEPSCLIP